MSIGDFISDKKDEFLKFCLNNNTTDAGTRNGYFKKLLEMKDIYVPADLAALSTTTKTAIRAVPKFLKFADMKYGITNYNGYTASQWKGNQREVKYAVGSRAGYKTKNLTDAEVVSGYKSIKDKEAKFCYLLCACSGARPAHLAKWLQMPDRKIEMLDGKIIRADVRETTSGKKQEVYFYFPAELKPAIENFKLKRSIRTIEKLCQTGTKERPINLSSLRKWNFNLLMDNDVPQITANAMQGRAQIGIDAVHYFDAAGSGAKYYPKIAAHIRKMKF